MNDLTWSTDRKWVRLTAKHPTTAKMLSFKYAKFDLQSVTNEYKPIKIK